ncbi:MAG: hypothetical protein N2Z23_07095 [Pyrinomonadaceae bacterium]|nr:hypothetical protein [Pyrinomonadaceae bacterium]MCX7640190.1 hypothetical protein [Pyrinomonadaceae bacterium]MDW8303222.1 hypothetical protein [Acidobacteriota bacterium]
MIERGDIVIAILQNPREKLIGTVQKISSAGVFLRGVDLNYFDDLINAIKKGEEYLPMQDYFLPMWRLEKLVKDEGSEVTDSLSEKFRSRTGMDLREF